MTIELAVQIPDTQLSGTGVLAQIDKLVYDLSAAEANLEQGYATLGWLLTEVSENKLWQGKFESFGSYMIDLGSRFNRGRTSLYGYMSTVRDLKDYVSSKQLTEMGVSKAGELRRAVKATGTAPTPEILEKAVQPSVSVKDVRKLLYDTKQVGESEPGEWLDLDMSGFVTPDQKLLILSAFKAADRTDPVIQPTMKSSARNIERLTRFAMEYLNAHAEEEE